MAIQNVRFEIPLAVQAAPIPTLDFVAFDSISTSIVGGDLPANLAAFPIDDANAVPLWEFEIQASALNVRPAVLMVGVDQGGGNGVQFTTVELAPGGSYSYKKADLSTLSIFKTQSEVEENRMILASITIVRARTEAFTSPDGALTFDITGVTATY